MVEPITPVLAGQGRSQGWLADSLGSKVQTDREHQLSSSGLVHWHTRTYVHTHHTAKYKSLLSRNEQYA